MKRAIGTACGRLGFGDKHGIDLWSWNLWDGARLIEFELDDLSTRGILLNNKAREAVGKRVLVSGIVEQEDDEPLCIRDIDSISVIEDEPGWRLRIRRCRRCYEIAPPLAFFGEEGAARPLFHEEGDLESDILFVLEAPNLSDTFDSHKGRLTFGEASDPTGSFFEECLEEQLGIRPEQTMIINSVLCLPARIGGKHPVCADQRSLCSPNLVSTIESVDPMVIATLGTAALDALRLIERHRLKLRDAVARPHKWFGRILFPLYHPGTLGRVSRSADKQRADYRTLRSFMEEHLWIPD